MTEDMFADSPPEEPSASALRAGKKAGTNFILLYGLDGLNTYLVKHKALPALSLLLAIHRRLELSGKARAPLTPAVWKDAGNPSKTTRETLLAHLHRMPDLVALHEDHHVMFRYRAEKGPAWHEIEKAGREGRAPTKEEELEKECLED